MTHLSIGEHPQSSPEYVGPCARCIGERARQAVHDAIYDLKHGASFPKGKGDAADFETEFALTITRMAWWCQDRAESNAREQDNDPCERHRPSKDDDQ